MYDTSDNAKGPESKGRGERRRRWERGEREREGVPAAILSAGREGEESITQAEHSARRTGERVFQSYGYMLQTFICGKGYPITQFLCNNPF